MLPRPPVSEPRTSVTPPVPTPSSSSEADMSRSSPEIDVGEDVATPRTRSSGRSRRL